MTAPWMNTAQSLLGTKEAPGTADNPVILKWSNAIAKKFPDLARYTKEYIHDSIPWCGDFVAYCLAANGIKPVTKEDGATYGFLWADDWKYFGVPVTPRPGAVMVFTRSGGGHVAFYVGEDATTYTVLGGNQSDAVMVMKIAKSKFTAARWPKEAAVEPVLPLPPPITWTDPILNGPPDVELIPAPETLPAHEPWTVTKVVGAAVSAGGASVLAFINSPYALAALVVLLVFGFFIAREFIRKQK